jgi:hypothetical protein
VRVKLKIRQKVLAMRIVQVRGDSGFVLEVQCGWRDINHQHEQNIPNIRELFQQGTSLTFASETHRINP